MELTNWIDLIIAGLWILIAVMNSRDFDAKSLVIWLATILIMLFVVRNFTR